MGEHVSLNKFVTNNLFSVAEHVSSKTLLKKDHCCVCDNVVLEKKNEAQPLFCV